MIGFMKKIRIMMIYTDTGRDFILLHSTETNYEAQKYATHRCIIQCEVHPSSSTVMDKEISLL
jgi:hypothetical protein